MCFAGCVATNFYLSVVCRVQRIEKQLTCVELYTERCTLASGTNKKLRRLTRSISAPLTRHVFSLFLSLFSISENTNITKLCFWKFYEENCDIIILYRKYFVQKKLIYIIFEIPWNLTAFQTTLFRYSYFANIKTFSKIDKKV